VEGLDGGRPKGRRREARDRSERGRLPGSPQGVSWLTGGGLGVGVHGGSVMTSIVALWRQKVEEEEGVPPFPSQRRRLQKGGASGSGETGGTVER
jgi:hypothetical protein